MHWREDVLTLPHCQAQVGGRHGLIFIGPRIKMGIYEGVPTRVAPHTTTGSADYFGPLVNRYTAPLMSHLGMCVSILCLCLSACLCVVAQSIADSLNYSTALASPIGKPHWQVPLASSIGTPHWHAPLASPIGKSHRQVSIGKSIGKPHWQAPLATPIGMSHWQALLLFP